MGPPSYKRSVVDRNVVMRRMTVYCILSMYVCYCGKSAKCVTRCRRNARTVHHITIHTWTSHYTIPATEFLTMDLHARTPDQGAL